MRELIFLLRMLGDVDGHVKTPTGWTAGRLWTLCMNVCMCMSSWRTHRLECFDQFLFLVVGEFKTLAVDGHGYSVWGRQGEN